VAIDRELEEQAAVPATHAVGDQRPSPDLQELGAPGTRIFGGFISTEEYVPELTGVRGLDVFERMRRSDGMVAAALRGIKLPLLSAEWDIVAASEDPLDLEIADFVRKNLFERLAWQEHLREVLTFLDFGFSVFEKVWDVVDVVDAAAQQYHQQWALDMEKNARDIYEFSGRRVRVPTQSLARYSIATRQQIVLKKIAPRLQRTIWRWNTDDHGDVVTVDQQKWLNSEFSLQTIPMDKLLVFTNEKEGGNYLGRSILRPAYKHWFIKDQLYRIQAIAAERHGVGIPVMAMPADKSDEKNISRAEDILAGIRANERGYVVELFGYKFRVEGTGSSAVMDLDPMIKHHDFMISVSVLAQFLTLGSQEQGARALAQDLTALFLMTEEALGAQVADIHNRHLIPELVNYNYAGITKYPRLTVSSIESRNVVALLSSIAQATAGKLLTPDLELENLLRKWIGAKPLDSKTVLPAADPNDPSSMVDDPSKPPAPTAEDPAGVGQGESES
jgi:hypothetical protein